MTISSCDVDAVICNSCFFMDFILLVMKHGSKRINYQVFF